jgi:hypothetical protein
MERGQEFFNSWLDGLLSAGLYSNKPPQCLISPNMQVMNQPQQHRKALYHGRYVLAAIISMSIMRGVMLLKVTP